MSSAVDWEGLALERRCSQCSRETPGAVYAGRDYRRVLQGMEGDEAAWQAHKVEPFFWSDADIIHVRLCDDCAARLGLKEAAPPILSTATLT
jgi:hypothetical protein